MASVAFGTERSGAEVTANTHKRFPTSSDRQNPSTTKHIPNETPYERLVVVKERKEE